MSFTRRWRGRSKKDVSNAMVALARKRSDSMTKTQKTEHAIKMVKARETKRLAKAV